MPLNRLAAAVMIVGLAACTSNDPEHDAVDDELMRPSSPQVQREGLRADRTDPSRTGKCPDLSGAALRACLERVQHHPENGQELPAEPEPGRPDPSQELPDRDGRPPTQTPANRGQDGR